MEKNLRTAALAFIAVVLVIALVAKFMLPNYLKGGSKGGSGGLSGDAVALIHVEGAITGDSAMGGPFAEVGASSVSLCQQLYEIKDDPYYKAVLLRVNSPGGSAAASDEIYRAVLAVQKAGKPVVVSMGDVAASGGYYISAPADYVYALPATMTGSIGVIFQLINWDKAAEKLGINDETLHAGKFKDIGSPWRPMSAEERSALDGMLRQVHEQFIKAVDAGRKNLDEAAVRKLATGMIYNGEEAAKNGLVDGLGSLEDAKAKARELAKLPADAPVEEYGGGSIWDEFFGATSRSQLLGAGLTNSNAEVALSAALRHGAADSLMQLSRGLYLNNTLRDLVVR